MNNLHYGQVKYMNNSKIQIKGIAFVDKSSNLDKA